MRYEVPRYIEEEAKVVGQVNIKQFFIFLGGGLVCSLLFFFLKTGIAIVLSVIILGSMTILMFGKYKGRPVYAIINGMLKYLWQPRTYVWQKQVVKQQELYQETQQKPELPTTTEEQKNKNITQEDLKKLAQQLDKK